MVQYALSVGEQMLFLGENMNKQNQLSLENKNQTKTNVLQINFFGEFIAIRDGISPCLNSEDAVLGGM